MSSAAKVLTKRTVCRLQSTILQVGADVWISSEAKLAFHAGKARLYCDSLPDKPVFDIRANFRYNTSRLVTKNQGFLDLVAFPIVAV